jgi:outer membrane protein TolC
MKKLLLMFLLLPFSIGFKAYAQESFINSVNNDLLEKYIDAARQHSLTRKMSDKRAQVLKTAIPVTALSYLDIVNVSYIFRPSGNQAVVTPGVGANPYAFNGLQYGLSLSLGSFLTKPFQIKAAKINYEIAKLEESQFDITLETEVKNRYYNYLQAVAQLKLSTQTLQDAALISESLKTKFENGTATLDSYDQSRASVNGAKSGQISAEVNLLKTRDLLEEIIGKKLSEIK